MLSKSLPSHRLVADDWANLFKVASFLFMSFVSSASAQDRELAPPPPEDTELASLNFGTEPKAPLDVSRFSWNQCHSVHPSAEDRIVYAPLPPSIK